MLGPASQLPAHISPCLGPDGKTFAYVLSRELWNEVKYDLRSGEKELFFKHGGVADEDLEDFREFLMHWDCDYDYSGKVPWLRDRYRGLAHRSRTPLCLEQRQHWWPSGLPVLALWRNHTSQAFQGRGCVRAHHALQALTFFRLWPCGAEFPEQGQCRQWRPWT